MTTQPTITAYQSRHRIEPVAVWLPGGTEPDHMACVTCGVEVYRIRDHSWRHDASTLPFERPPTWPR